ncbi:MAG: collagen-like protein [Robiginitalea sp.]|jgi:hypothetical protein
MKKLGLLFGLMISLLALSCEGPSGPPGPPGVPGLDGLDGINILGQVYDIVGDFTPPNYSIFSEFAIDAPSVEVFETDVVLVYILWEQVDDPTGPIDVWRLLPQTRLLDEGILQYNYDHTFLDVSIFLESNFDPGLLGPGDTDNQIFRIAIIPADGAGLEGLDVSNMQAVLDYLNVDESSVSRYELD